ncbi:MAG: TrmB family transcriptional regulator [Nocardioidaceae bacterium]
MTDVLAVERLVRLGLTQYEARAYVAMVRRDGSTAAEVARLAGVPRPRIYDVIDSLIGKGLVTDRPGRTTSFVPKSPAETVDLLVRIHRGRLEALELEAAAVRDELEPAFLEGALQTDPLDYIELIRSSEQVGKRFNELQQGVRKEMLVFAKMPAAVSIAENDAGLGVARDHVLRTVYEMSFLEDPGNRAGVKHFINAGERARFVEQVPMKLGIIDERIVMMAMSDPVAGLSELTTLVIENVQLAKCLKIVFEQVWSSGTSFTAACRRQGVPRPR